MNKDFIFLILLLVIIAGVFFWQNPQIFSKLKAIVVPELEFAEDSALDLSEINIENLLGEEPAESPSDNQADKEPAFTEVSAGEEENGIGGPLIGELPEGEETLEQEVVVMKKQLTLEEIEQEVNRIAKEVERIDKEVQILVALSKIQ